MNLFDLIPTERPPKGIIRTTQGGWVGKVKVGDVVNINNESFRIVGPPHYDTLALCDEIENGYVLIEPDGSRIYYDTQDRLHRDDSPAVIYPNGAYAWYQHGKLHREDGPAQLISTGTQHWWIDGKRHREDGPAVVKADGTQEWYQRGRRHREDGPAVTRADGTVEYWIDGNRVEREDLP